MPYADPEKRKANRREWSQRNAVAVKAYRQEYEAANRERILADKKARYQANRLAIIAKNTARDKARRAAKRRVREAKVLGWTPPPDEISIHPEIQKRKLVARDNERIAKRLENEDEVWGPEEAGHIEQRAPRELYGSAINPRTRAREAREVAGMVAALLHSRTYDESEVYRLAVANRLPYSVPELEAASEGAPCATDWRSATNAERAATVLRVVRQISAERERTR